MKHNPTRFFLLAFLMIALAYLGWNHVLHLRAEEPRRAIVAIEMMLSNSYIVPKIHAEPYFNKPPLFNWILVGFFKLFGTSNEWVVRLPSTLSWLLLAFGVYRLTRKYLGNTVAVWAGIICLTASDVLYYGTLMAGEIDLFFSALVFLQAALFFIFSIRRQWFLLFVLAYAAGAIAVLTKGVPAVAFSGLTLVPWLIYRGEWKRLFSWQHLVGISLFAGILFAYFSAYQQQGDAVGYIMQLLFEASQRTIIEDVWSPLKSLVGFPWLILKMLFPWSLCFLCFVRKDFLKYIRDHKLLAFAILFIVANAPVYWLANYQKTRYIYPFVPFFAILLAYFAQFSLGRGRDFVKVITERLVPGVLALAAVSVLVLPFLPIFQGTVSHIIVFSLLLFSAGIATAYAYWRGFLKPFSGIVALLIWVRFLMNIMVLPLMDKDTKPVGYHKDVVSMLKISKGASIYWTGPRYTFEAKAPYVNYTRALSTPPIIVYQIPYYMAYESGKILAYDPDPKPGNYYLAFTSQLSPGINIDILYRCFDDANKQELVLFRLKPQVSE